MTQEKSTTANTLLKQERELRGWSQGYLAEQIGAPASSYISRWERGEVLPSPYYREKLCKLFDKNAQDLGLLSYAEMSADEAVGAITDIPQEISEQETTDIVTDRSDRSSSSVIFSPRTSIFHRIFRSRSRIIALSCVLIVLFGGTASFWLLSRHPQRNWPAYNQGTEGLTALTLQLLLRSHGYSLGDAGVDGFFGPLTKNAVEQFQRDHNINANGIVEAATWEALVTPPPSGETPDSILALQMQLGLNLANADLQTNGDLDHNTRQALRTFQQAHGLPVNGLINTDVWYQLIHETDITSTLTRRDNCGTLAQNSGYTASTCLRTEARPEGLQARIIVMCTTQIEVVPCQMVVGSLTLQSEGQPLKKVTGTGRKEGIYVLRTDIWCGASPEIASYAQDIVIRFPNGHSTGKRAMQGSSMEASCTAK